jgi:hypothetical protein
MAYFVMFNIPSFFGGPLSPVQGVAEDRFGVRRCVTPAAAQSLTRLNKRRAAHLPRPPALPRCAAYFSIATLICRGLAASTFGSRTVSRPASNFATILFASIVAGKVKDRSNIP